MKIEIQALQQKLEAEKEINRVKLHEATSAARQTVNQHMLETIAERANVERLKFALNASTDDIRKGRAAQSFNDQLTTELKETRQTAKSSKMEADRLETEKREFFEQQMTNEVQKAKRTKRNDEDLVEATPSNSRPLQLLAQVESERSRRGRWYSQSIILCSPLRATSQLACRSLGSMLLSCQTPPTSQRIQHQVETTQGQTTSHFR